MKVPTYRSQTAIPKQGRGQFLSAQLNAGAMMAPGQAFEALGSQVAQAGQQLAAWGFKKAQIGAQSEAQGAANLMEIALAQKSQDALQLADMSAAETQFRHDAKLLSSQYSSNLSSSAARTAFASEALKLQTRAIINFNKLNNKRVLDAHIANVDRSVAQEQRVVSDIGANDDTRTFAFDLAIDTVDNAKGDLGAKEHAKRIDAINVNAVENTLSAYLNASDADVLTIVQAFREGNLDDPIIAAASANLSVEKIAEIADNGVKRANQIIKLRKNIREELEIKADAENTAIHSSIVNTDFDDPLQVEIARELFQTLLDANYFKNDAPKRRAVENLFDPSAAFPKRSELTDRVEGELSEAASLDELTYEMLLDAKANNEITREFYNQHIANLETEFNESKQAGIDIFRDAFKYSELADKGELSNPSRQAFRKASIAFKAWTEDNRKASRSEILGKAREIAQESVGDFEAVLKVRRFQIITAEYSRLRTNLKSKIPAPTADNFEEFKNAVMAQAAAQGSSIVLKRLLETITKEMAIRAFD